MCGIAGAIPEEPLPLDIVPRIWDLLAHRGPDDRGYLALRGRDVHTSRHWQKVDRASELLLIHTRLSVIDLSDSGWQPMSSRDGRHHLVFNGEIYNYLELRRTLERAGSEFRSRSDTEVLLQAFATWGAGCLGRIEGMYAFAALDMSNRTLFIARDEFGIKPLFFARGGGIRFAFASEPAALLKLVNTPRRANRESVIEFLRFGLTDHTSRSMFEGIEHLPAGHSMSVDLSSGSGEKKRYWRLKPPELTPTDVNVEEVERTVRAGFMRNVETQMRSDVPIGAALSGGIDSSAIVMAMREIGGESLDLRVFGFVSNDEAQSEERWIDLVGRASRAEVVKVRPSTSELLSNIGSLIAQQGEPFGSMSAYAQREVFRAARESGVKVMLDGQGADELLAGYRHDISARIAFLIARGELMRAWRLAGSTGMLDDYGRLRSLIRSAGFLAPRAWQGLGRRVLGRPLALRWMNVPEEEVLKVLPGDTLASGTTNLNERIAHQVEQNLPHLLRVEDRNSMSVSVESRVPFLTREFAELIIGLPEDQIVSDGAVTKSVFRAAMRGMVPDQVLDRRDKIGFWTPKGWLLELEPWIVDVLSSEAALNTSVLDLPYLRANWRQMAVQSTSTNWDLWKALNLIEWTRQYEVTIPRSTVERS